MTKQEILRETAELRSMMAKATEIVEKLGAVLPSSEQQPAINAQCNVMRSFLWQVENQERLFAEMVDKKLRD